jgi:hypothetical protein
MSASIVIKKEGDSSAKREQRCVKLEEMEDAKQALPMPRGKIRSKTSGLRETTIALSSIKELLVTSTLMLERLQPPEDELTTKRPEIIDVHPSNQDGTFAIKKEKMTNTVTDSAVSISQKPDVTSNCTNTTCSTEEKVLLRSSREFIPLFALKKQMEYNVEFILEKSKERDGLMIRGRDKTRENAKLTSLLLKLSEKQALLLSGKDR